MTGSDSGSRRETAKQPAIESANTALSGVASGGPVSASAAPRFAYVDGLRGIASIMVAVSHLADAAEDKHPGILGPGVVEFADLGRFGVQIFFVLSGFVIAHSVITGKYSFGYLGRFVGRRFIRLDLPYWSVIALEILLLFVSGLIMVEYSRELPSIPQILANAFYLQQYLGYEHISPVFWTLCYEVQFYLVFVISLVLLTKLRELGVSARSTRWVGAFALAVSSCWSLSIFLDLLPMMHKALFIDRWFQFAFGVLAYLYFRGNCGWQWVLAATVLCTLCGLAFGETSYRIGSTLLTAGTALAILASLRFPGWNSLLVGPTVQFLGRISYSLYLLHAGVGWRATVVTRELVGSAYSTTWAYIAFAVGLAASVLSAWIMYLLIERPAINVARLIRLPQRREPQLVPA